MDLCKLFKLTLNGLKRLTEFIRKSKTKTIKDKEEKFLPLLHFYKHQTFEFIQKSGIHTAFHFIVYSLMCQTNI